MKKTLLLNAELSYLIAKLGHGDCVVIADAGLPAPTGVKVIDLALKRGVPSFDQVLEAVLSEMQVERATCASEVSVHSPTMLVGMRCLLDGVPLEEVSHSELKALCGSARAIVRTGEFTPYANLMLYSGVVF